jgi:hypothetical protein
VIPLGSKVRDSVTGVEGIVTSRTNWLTGCATCGVQQKVGKDGKVPDAMHFDEPRLEVLVPPPAEKKPPTGTGVG